MSQGTESDDARPAVVSLNVGERGTLETARGPVETGFDKRPRAATYGVTEQGIDGDFRADPQGRHEPDRAVCAYPFEHYGFWRGRPGLTIGPPGHFGENLTVIGLLETDVRIGDVYRCGSAHLQVSQPRIPCRKLDAKLGEGFSKRFLRSLRTGYYLRVVQSGALRSGETLELMARDAGAVSVAECVRYTYFEYWDREALQRVLGSAGLASTYRHTVQERLAHADGAEGWAGMRPMSVRLSDTQTEASLRCPDGRPLPSVEGAELVTLVWRPAEDARALRGIFRVHGPTAEGEGFVVSTVPDHGDNVFDALRVHGSEGQSLVHVSAPKAHPAAT